MNIGIDARTLQDKYYSGVPEYSFQLLKAMFRLDTQNTYHLFYNSSHDLSGTIPKFDFPNVIVHKFDYPNKFLNYAMLMPFGLPWLDKLLGEIDIFFSPHVNFIAVSKGTKFVLTIHDLSFLRYPEFFSWRKNIWHTCLGLKKLVKRADLIIAVSENTKNDISQLLDVGEDKIQVIYSSISDSIKPTTDQSQLESIKNKYSLPEKFLLYLGTIEPRKNLEALIEAFELLKQDPQYHDLHLVLAGGDGWKNNSVYKFATESNFKNFIHLIGYIDREDKSALYSLARAFVYPSYYEGFGFPPLEASACGKPILTSYSSSLPEIVNSKAILVNPYDVLEIKNGMIKLLRVRDLPEVKLPSWDEVAQEYLNAFKKLTNSSTDKSLTD